MIPDEGRQIDRTSVCTVMLVLVLTGFYFAGPLLVAAELLKPAFSIPLLLLFGAWFWTLASVTVCSAESPRQNREAMRGSTLVTWITLIACLVLCFVWVYLSGIGGLAYCRGDYIKHNFIFSQLLDGRLPILVPFRGRDVLLHYGFAYYILPVRVTELVGISLNLVLVLGYSIILFLSLVLLGSLHRIPVLWLLLSFTLIGGLDIFGALAFGLPPWAKHLATIPYLNIEVAECLDWWGTPWAPANLTTVLFNAPQHFFGALVGTALLYGLLQCLRSATVLLASTIILVAASAFWSPYVAIGLTMLLILELGTNQRGVTQRLRGADLASLLTREGLTVSAFAVALCAFVWLFYTAAEPLSNPHLLLRRVKLTDWLLTYVLNYAPSLFALIFVSVPQAWSGGQDPSSAEQDLRRRLSWRLAGGLVLSAGLLSLSHGVYNDWAMRTTLPLSIMLTISITQLILSRSLRQWSRPLLLVVVVLSTVSSLNELAQAVLLNRNCAPYGVYQLEDLRYLASQYRGRRDSILYSYFVRWR